MCLAEFCSVVSWSRFARISLISVADSEGSGRRSFVCCTRKVQSVRQQISTKRASNNGDAANTTCVRTSSHTSGTIAGFASTSLSSSAWSAQATMKNELEFVSRSQLLLLFLLRAPSISLCSPFSSCSYKFDRSVSL